jgi:hypothetical protein
MWLSYEELDQLSLLEEPLGYAIGRNNRGSAWESEEMKYSFGWNSKLLSRKLVLHVVSTVLEMWTYSGE